jgi:hypothetical protein
MLKLSIIIHIKLMNCMSTFSLPAYKSIFPYKAQEEGDLSFDVGETILVLECLENGWWRGCIGESRAGWFPGNYVEVSDVLLCLNTAVNDCVVRQVIPETPATEPNEEPPLAFSSPRAKNESGV